MSTLPEKGHISPKNIRWCEGNNNVVVHSVHIFMLTKHVIWRRSIIPNEALITEKRFVTRLCARMLSKNRKWASFSQTRSCLLLLRLVLSNISFSTTMCFLQTWLERNCKTIHGPPGPQLIFLGLARIRSLPGNVHLASPQILKSDLCIHGLCIEIRDNETVWNCPTN